MLEKTIEQRLVKKVQQAGGVAYKWVAPGQSGVPDRIVIMPTEAGPARVFFVELKTDTGRLSKVQERQHMRLKALGADVRVVWGRDGVDAFIEEVMQ